MFVTTAGRTDDAWIQIAKNTAQQLNVDYVSRRKKSVKELQKTRNDDCIVVGKERLEMYPFGEDEPFFFHPNSAMFRVKRLLRGEEDPFIAATKLEKGSTFLDCTLGLASDSIVASVAVGNEGKVVGVEGNRYLSFIVKNGLQNWQSNSENVNEAMRKIIVVNQVAINYLQTLEDNSFDCVYFDPMFEDTILESDGIKALSRFALFNDISNEMMSEAIRVSKKRIVLKDHFKSQRFAKFGFNVLVRKTAKFHYGVIEK